MRSSSLHKPNRITALGMQIASVLQAGCWAGLTEGLIRVGVVYEGTSDREKKKRKPEFFWAVLEGRMVVFPSLVFSTVNNLPCFL